MECEETADRDLFVTICFRMIDDDGARLRVAAKDDAYLAQLIRHMMSIEKAERQQNGITFAASMCPLVMVMEGVGCWMMWIGCCDSHEEPNLKTDKIMFHVITSYRYRYYRLSSSVKLDEIIEAISCINLSLLEGRVLHTYV